jgi:ABC-type nitrate/sulfonate/bicarbonate transport system substrate-binding protein
MAKHKRKEYCYMKTIQKNPITVITVFLLLITVALPIFSAGVQAEQEDAAMEEITVILDWVPNTNHTGVYTALDLGYYAEEGLAVRVVQPAEGGSADLVAAGKGEFGFSYQEQVTYARTAEVPLPIVAVAAVIQHNTSGFASPSHKGINRPKDMEGKTYGGWGAPMEEAVLAAIMEKDGADYSSVKIVNIGAADFFSSVERDVDFSWIFYGWDGVMAELKGFPLNYINLQEIDKNLDYYTPVLIASEKTIRDRPELVRKFLAATSKGYGYCIDNPEDSAAILLKYAPEIPEALAVASQRYLAAEYQADSPKWGLMKVEVWENYSGWMDRMQLLHSALDAEKAFTNDFLP